jgi:hypothetical protein
MVQIADPVWTKEAIHSACLKARKLHAKIALMNLIPVQHHSWLGTDLGFLNFSSSEIKALAEYEAIIKDYGVKFTTYYFQYVSLPGAIQQSADYAHAQIVYATFPKSIIPFWRNFQIQWLRHRLSQQERELIEQPNFDIDSFSLAKQAVHSEAPLH